MHRFIELSHVIEAGMTTYTGLPGPKISDYLSREGSKGHYSDGTTFQIGKIEMVANTGTYIDDTADGSRPTHTILLGANIPIVEHMCNLGALPLSGFKFFAVPAPARGMGSFPVRAFAIIEE